MGTRRGAHQVTGPCPGKRPGGSGHLLGADGGPRLGNVRAAPTVPPRRRPGPSPARPNRPDVDGRGTGTWDRRDAGPPFRNTALGAPGTALPPHGGGPPPRYSEKRLPGRRSPDLGRCPSGLPPPTATSPPGSGSRGHPEEQPAPSPRTDSRQGGFGPRLGIRPSGPVAPHATHHQKKNPNGGAPPPPQGPPSGRPKPPLRLSPCYG